MPVHAANILTLARILLIPLLVVAFYKQTGGWRFIAALVFFIGCLTDYLDGYVARTFSQTSRLGQFLDPVADKLLVASTLLMLAGFQRISVYALIPALIILCREILVSGLREHLSHYRVTLGVSRLAKWKTGIQMTSICCLLIGDIIDFTDPIHVIGECFLWIAAILTMITGYKYIRESLMYL